MMAAHSEPSAMQEGVGSTAETVICRKGDSYLVPLNVAHAQRALERTVTVDVFSPPRSEVPLHKQIRVRIGRLVGEGILPPDARVPGTREMARLLRVSRNTVIRAYDELVADGCLKVIPRKGIFVESDCRPRAAPRARPPAAATASRASPCWGMKPGWSSSERRSGTSLASERGSAW
ncbi:MAG: GntR family transcriptional regulator [Bacillota bacterium]